MDIQIKKYADSGDLKALKYIFVDALDVDPTFVRYEEEYNYCKSISGLLEPHKELTPFVQDKSRWNESYWTSLKTDLIKNFSDRRMMHMKEVAQVFLAEKVQRILAERSAAVQPTTESTPTTPSASEIKPRPVSPVTPKVGGISKAEQERLELEAAKHKLEEENHRTEAERLAKERARQIEQQRMLHQEQTQTQGGSTGGSSKKVIGIAVAAIAVVAVVLFLVLKSRNPAD